MSSRPAVRVEGLGKCYEIYDRPGDRLLQGFWRGRRRLYREFWALRDVSFEVAKGETVGIVGRNGSGKSTLLQLVCGTVTPTTGSIEIDGRVAALLELGAGFNPEFTGRENVYMNAAILGLSKAETDERYDDIVAFADIGEFLEQPVKSYSSGMSMRLAFAVSANVDADILVVDEALAVGDAFFTRKCMRFLRGFMERGTLLFVSHDSSAVVNLCSRAVWLDHGRARMMADAKTVTEAYRASVYEAQQGPSPAGDGSPGSAAASDLARRTARVPRDQRMEFVNRTNLRNDLEVFRFNPEARSFGLRGATVEDVRFVDLEGHKLTGIVGGEEVAVEVDVAVHRPLFSPIVGFGVIDRLGQPLFGENSYLTYAAAPLRVEAGRRFTARFAFRMPILSRGHYTVTATVAEGTQADHVQHHWVDDALAFESLSSSLSTGLVGIPMSEIALVERAGGEGPGAGPSLG